MTKNTATVKNISFIAILITLAVIWRVVNNKFGIVPNLEIVTVASVLAAITLGWRASLTVALLSMVLSDLIIGNSSIFVFTWGSFALIGLGAVILRKLNDKPKTQIFASIGFAAVSSFLFFVITNFGVWAQGWYPATTAGLIDCFVMAIPFYRTMLITNLIMIPSTIAAWQYAKAHHSSKKSVVNSPVRN